MIDDIGVDIDIGDFKEPASDFLRDFRLIGFSLRQLVGKARFSDSAVLASKSSERAAGNQHSPERMKFNDKTSMRRLADLQQCFAAVKQL